MKCPPTIDMSGLWQHPRGLCDLRRPPACAPRVRRCRRDQAPGGAVMTFASFTGRAVLT